MARATAVLACAALLAPAAALSAEFDCMIEARQMVEIRSSVEAVIESVKVQRGSHPALAAQTTHESLLPRSELPAGA